MSNPINPNPAAQMQTLVQVAHPPTLSQIGRGSLWPLAKAGRVLQRRETGELVGLPILH